MWFGRWCTNEVEICRVFSAIHFVIGMFAAMIYFSESSSFYTSEGFQRYSGFSENLLYIESFLIRLDIGGYFGFLFIVCYSGYHCIPGIFLVYNQSVTGYVGLRHIALLPGVIIE